MPQARTAVILPFKRPVPRVLLTTADRIEALHWAANSAEASVRLAFHRWADGEAAEATDYVSIYRGDDSWAAWGAARHGRFVKVWRCANGADVGHFTTMAEALAALGFTARRQA